MAAEEILWNVGICASTYAELGEAWATLRMMNAQLDEPDGGKVLYESGAAGYYHTAHDLVLDALRGLDQFLGIQGNYLDGIKRGVHVDLTELKSKFADQGQEPSYAQQEAAGAAILAQGKATGPATPGQTGLNPETYATRTDFSSGEIYPGLFAYETPPNWLTDWLQYVSYASSSTQNLAKTAPWTNQVQYAGA